MVSQASWAPPPFHSFLLFLLKTKPENNKQKPLFMRTAGQKWPAVDTHKKSPWSPRPASTSQPTLWVLRQDGLRSNPGCTSSS